MPQVTENHFGDDRWRFHTLRADAELDGQDFADRVCRLELFVEKFQLAATLLKHRRRISDDAIQTAWIKMHNYLAKTRGRAFADQTGDALGGWFYCLARQHMRWAQQNIRRSDGRQLYHEQAAAKSPIQLSDDPIHTEQLAALVEAVARLPETLRQVIAAILLDESVATITRRLKISRRTFYRRREEGFALLHNLLQDDDEDRSSPI